MGVIYKIQVHDEIYIGSTCDLRLRQNEHRHNCKNINARKYNGRLYQKCRENDINIVLIPLEEVAGLKGGDLRMLEQEYIDRLNPELNTIRAYRTEEQRKAYDKERYLNDPEFVKRNKARHIEYYKKTKEFTTCECGCVLTIQNLTRHKKTKKHLTLMNNINNIN